MTPRQMDYSIMPLLTGEEGMQFGTVAKGQSGSGLRLKI